MFNKKQAITIFSGLLFCFSTLHLSAQTDYRNYSKLSQKIKNLHSNYSSLSKLEVLTTTVGGHKIWALTLSKGNAKNKPAIAIVSGVDGKHILGPEMAVSIAENILKNHADVLENTAFYIFPNMSPNATENYFSSLKHYKNGNARKTDDDRDGTTNEDPFEDLNKDGLITLMRIKDPTGNYILHKPAGGGDGVDPFAVRDHVALLLVEESHRTRRELLRAPDAELQRSSGQQRGQRHAQSRGDERGQRHDAAKDRQACAEESSSRHLALLRIRFHDGHSSSLP